MSKIAIKGATTGTGTFTIESPATNTDRTLTLPDEAGTVVTKNGSGTIASTNISDGTNSTSTTNVVKGSAKAWANYNGSSNTLDNNYGVSSVTDNGTGDFTFNFTTAFANANYAVSGAVGNDNNADSTSTCIRPGAKTTSSCRVSINYASAGTNSLYDYSDISIVIFGD